MPILFKEYVFVVLLLERERKVKDFLEGPKTCSRTTKSRSLCLRACSAWNLPLCCLQLYLSEQCVEPEYVAETTLARPLYTPFSSTADDVTYSTTGPTSYYSESDDQLLCCQLNA